MPARCGRSLINLLSNAVKFTERGRIAVRASSAGDRDGSPPRDISVEDTGPGIAPAHLDRIFEAFDQAESVVRSGGTGLGLTISRNFARLMGGDLIVDSELGKGSVFTLSFEADVASRAEVPGRARRRFRSGSPRTSPLQGADRGRRGDEPQPARRPAVGDRLRRPERRRAAPRRLRCTTRGS